MKPDVAPKRKKDRRAAEKELRTSLAFYFALILLAGQFLAMVLTGREPNVLFALGTFAIVIGILFGPGTMVEFVRAIRGSRSERRGGGGDEA